MCSVHHFTLCHVFALCGCRYTVRKEGPNQGRGFFKCAKTNRDSQCNFFQWADASASGGAAASSHSAAGYGSAPGMLYAPGQKRPHVASGGGGGGGSSADDGRPAKKAATAGSVVRKCSVCKQPGKNYSCTSPLLLQTSIHLLAK